MDAQGDVSTHIDVWSVDMGVRKAFKSHCLEVGLIQQAPGCIHCSYAKEDTHGSIGSHPGSEASRHSHQDGRAESFHQTIQQTQL